MKSVEVKENFLANKYLSEKVPYPFHIGITEAGVFEDAAILSSVGIGSLLINGIGDTIRVSISGNPLKEIEIAKSLLVLLGFENGIRVVACPTCARTEINVERLAYDVKSWIEGKTVNRSITISVMGGCIVNGPGEAKHSDLAIVGTKNSSAAVFFEGGKLYGTFKNCELKDVLLKLIDTI